MGTAPEKPWRAARRRISAMAGPGDAEISSTARAKAGREERRSTELIVVQRPTPFQAFSPGGLTS